jgi:hypothetical protein
MYGTGTDEASADCLMRQRVLASLPVAEQIRWYETFEEAHRQFTEKPADTTGKVINEPDQRNDDDAEHHEE